ncbi:MAG: LysR family transcriptional regulator [Pseudonocardia sp.]
MLLRRLEYVAALARERHFARAAATCHVSQPALSAGIRKLEAELRVQIVHHGRRFAGFTPEGERVVTWAQRMLADNESLRQDLALMRGGLTGVLRIGAIPTALTVAAQLTAPFCAAHPQVRLRLQALSSREIVRRLADFEIDVGMSYVDGEPLGPVRTVPLYRERYLLLTPAESPLARRRRVEWADLAGLPLCLLSTDMQNRRIVDRNLAAAGVGVEPVVEADAVSVLYAYAAAQRWSAIVAHAWLRLFDVPDGMWVVPMARPAHEYTIGLVLGDREPASMLARALLDAVGGVDLGADPDVPAHRS